MGHLSSEGTSRKESNSNRRLNLWLLQCTLVISRIQKFKHLQRCGELSQKNKSQLLKSNNLPSNKIIANTQAPGADRGKRLNKNSSNRNPLELNLYSMPRKKGLKGRRRRGPSLRLLSSVASGKKKKVAKMVRKMTRRKKKKAHQSLLKSRRDPHRNRKTSYSYLMMTSLPQASSMIQKGSNPTMH